MHAITNLQRAAHVLRALFIAASATALAAADNARVSASLAPENGRIVVDVHGVPPPAPVFFSATVEQSVRLAPSIVTGEMRIKLHVVQGRPEVLTLGLSGEGEVIEVSGRGLRDWSVRQAGDKRFLDLRPVLPASLAGASLDHAGGASRTSGLESGRSPPEPAQDFDLVVRTRLRKPSVPGIVAVLIATPGETVGFAAKVSLVADPAIDFRVTSANGLTPLGEPSQFHSTGDARLEVKLTLRGAALAEAELVGAQLTGKVNEAARSVAFRLRGTLRTQKAGARLRLLAGHAALSEQAAGDGWHVELVPVDGGKFAYDLVGDRAGVLPIDLTFDAVVRENGDWRTLDFAMPAGAVVPLELEGLGAGVSFQPDAPVVPVSETQASSMEEMPRVSGQPLHGRDARATQNTGGTPVPPSMPRWRGFLPANGSAVLGWKRTHEAGEGALFFTSTEQSEVRIGAGLLRQTAQISFRILQGRLAGVRVRLDGPGEILGVEGSNVVGWKVLPGGATAGRVLEVRFSRPMETQGALAIHSQAELGNWPVRAEPLRLTPEGGVRHSGFVRVANSGAVRLEVADVAGMMQLAPAQFPGAASEPGARQVFVYRFPSASYSYRVNASQIQPEVGVSAIVTYELAEIARVINAAIELDVREAPLRDWSLRIPEDYTVVAVNGSDMSDFVAESEAAGGYRTLRILFAREIEGRQLLQLRLEKNQAAAAGEWALPALQYPGAKSVRGHIGGVATPGYRLVPARVDRLVEVPLSLFPKQAAGLQQAWRLREPDWSVELRVEALGQSVQADVLHLYSLKQGVVYGSVLLNYFVVGAPAAEWRIEVPPALGNIDVTGQNVRRDWRREGSQVIVSLHQPVLGAATLLLTFEQPMSARGGVIAPGEVRPLGVQSERGFVQIVSPLQVKHGIRRIEGGLLKLEPAELPAEYRTFTSSPSLALYQYTARPIAFEMSVEWYAPGETVDQVVDFARLASQVSRDGQVVTEAKFFVKTRGRKALRLVLPAEVKLWEARVDGELVNARADADQTIVPLPARLNPNEPVVVALRLGQTAAGSGTRVNLVAPRVAAAPIVIDEWIVRGDAGRQLVPRGGNAELVEPALTETGFEWVSTRGVIGTFVTLALLAFGTILLRAQPGWRVPAGLLLLAIANGGALMLTVAALADRRANLSELTFAATMVPPTETVSLQLGNVSAWRAMIVGWGVVAIVAGLALLAAGRMLRLVGWPKLTAEPSSAAARRGRRALPLAGIVLIAAGLLAGHGGAVLFFAALSAAVFLLVLVPGLFRWRRERRIEDTPPAAEPGAGAATVVSLIVIGGLAFAFGGAGDLCAAQPKVAPAAPPVLSPGAVEPALLLPDGTKSADSLVQTWSIRGDRLFADIELTVRGATGDSFLLLRAPAVLTDFKADGLRVGKVERDGRTAYYVATERDGVLTARARFEMPHPDRTKPVALPTGPAAAQRVTIELDQGGWEFVSPMAVLVMPTIGLGENRSGAMLVLAAHAAPTIQLQPRRRDIAAETTQFFAEASNLYVPGPGVVNGFTRVTVRPVQGRVSGIEVDVPKGLTVGDVSRGPVGTWRFDPEKRRLHVAIEPAQTGVFKFDIETQLAAGELPFDIALEPLRILGAAGEVGMMAIAFGGDAQPEGVRPTGLAAVNVQDFDASLLPRPREGQPPGSLQKVWRYGATGGRVELKIAPVAPEVRVASRQVLSLDDDRLVMAVDLRVAITRVGLFKLTFALPEGLEIEAMSGPALNHWTETREAPSTSSGQGAQRIITLHLNGRTLGEQAFSLTLAGAAPRAQEAWPMPRLSVREATRQTGEALIVPARGLRLRAVDREKVTQLDPRTIGGQQPGTLAFRLLQDDWVLRLGIEVLEPWVTVQALQEVTLREGQTLTRIGVRYRIESATVKHVQLRLPGLGEESARTVRATGPAVSDLVRVTAGPNTADLWEIRFQRGVAGETDVQIEFQGPAASSAGEQNGQEPVVTPEFVGARQAVQFVAIRSGGRLELEAGVLPRGWIRVDWSAVPAHLQQRSDRSMPAFCFRVAEPESALTVNVRRHNVAEALKLRVTQGILTTLFAPTGASLTAIELKVDVLEKSTLRMRLPQGARLFNTFVNGGSVSVVREGDAYLFHVSPHTTGDRVAAVRLIYSVAPAGARGRVGLVGPSLSVPLENVTWRVVIPPGYELDDYTGSLRLREDRIARKFDVDDYASSVSAKRSAEAQQGLSLLQQASALLQKGEQEKAGAVLSQASNNVALDAASNEDARVQLRNLKTQQTILGLNTRRQRLYLDNRADAARNEQLEQAANLNPFMQGRVNFDPQQSDQLLMGNTVEENSALRAIASRIVDQQLAADPAPGAIDVTLPERGRVLTFTRSLQVDGGAPLELNLDVVKISRTSVGAALSLLLGLAGIAGSELNRRRREVAGR